MGKAITKAREIEAADEPTPPPPKTEPITIEQAITEYLADASARELRECTLYKLELIFNKQFLEWCKGENYKYLRDIDLRAVQAFRASWKDGALAKKKSRSG